MSNYEIEEIEIGVGSDALVETPARSSSGDRASLAADPPGATSGGDLDDRADEPPPGVKFVHWEDKLWPIVRVHPALDEKAYIAAERLATRLLISKGLKDPDGKREERAAWYASWRYRGWQAGEIRSL